MKSKSIALKKVRSHRLADAEDLLELRRARAADKGGPGLSVQEARRRLGVECRRSRRPSGDK